MRRVLILAVLMLTGCTVPSHGTPSAPPTVTHTVTATASPSGVPPCNAVHVEVAVAPGEGPSPDLWLTEIVLTNLGPGACSVEGVSDLTFRAGDSALPVDQTVTPGDGPPDLVILDVSDQAAMSVSFPTAPERDAPPNCLVGTGVVQLTLPNDTEPIAMEAWLPPVCGTVSVTPWYFGGAGAAAPN